MRLGWCKALVLLQVALLGLSAADLSRVCAPGRVMRAGCDCCKTQAPGVSQHRSARMACCTVGSRQLAQAPAELPSSAQFASPVAQTSHTLLTTAYVPRRPTH